MPDLVVYDSQGYGIGDHEGEHSERIQQFFFDGVRLALDTSGAAPELVVFFRARESEASRSEQYYAVYRGPVGEFDTALKRTVEGAYGMSIVTTTEDTAIYEVFESDVTVGEPTNTRQLDRAATLLPGSAGSTDPRPGGRGGRPAGGTASGTAEQVYVGVGTYEQAGEVVRYVRENGYTDRVAIAENAASPNLESYELVVEKGSYDGVELLPETRATLEPSRNTPTESPGREGGSGDDGRSRRAYILGIGIAAVVLLALLGGAVFVGLPLPGGGGDGAGLELESAELHGSDGVTVEGALDGDVTASDESFSVRIWANASDGDGGIDRENATPAVAVREVAATETGNGTFRLTVDAATIETAAPSFDYVGGTEYVVEVRVEGANETASTGLERGELALELTDAEWNDDGPSVRVTGRLTQGGAPVGIDSPVLGVTLSSDGESDVVNVAPDSTEGGSFEFTVQNGETALDLDAVESLQLSAAFGDAQAAIDVAIPGTLAVRVAGTNAPVTAGESLEVSVTVENTGGESSGQTVTLFAGPLGSDSTAVSVPGGDTTTETLTVATETGNAGEYTAQVSTADDTATTNVTVQAAGATGST